MSKCIRKGRDGATSPFDFRVERRGVLVVVIQEMEPESGRRETIFRQGWYSN